MHIADISTVLGSLDVDLRVVRASPCRRDGGARGIEISTSCQSSRLVSLMIICMLLFRVHMHHRFAIVKVLVFLIGAIREILSFGICRGFSADNTLPSCVRLNIFHWWE